MSKDGYYFALVNTSSRKLILYEFIYSFICTGIEKFVSCSLEVDHKSQMVKMDHEVSRHRYYVALFIKSVAFLFMMGACVSLNYLQSSLNPQEGLGLITLSVAYVANIPGSLFLAPVVARWLTSKWKITVGAALHLPFIVANFFPSWCSMLPTAAVNGLGKSILWLGSSLYITELAIKQAEIDQKDNMTLLSKFNGIFNAALSLIGFMQIMTAIIFSEDHHTAHHSVTSFSMCMYNNGTLQSKGGTDNDLRLICPTSSPDLNVTTDISFCGANHCPYIEEHIQIIKQPSDHSVYIFLVCVLILNVMAVCCSACLPEIDSKNNKEEVSDILSAIGNKLSSAFSVLKDSRMLLWLPTIIFSSMFMATIQGAFAQVSYNSVFLFRKQYSV